MKPITWQPSATGDIVVPETIASWFGGPNDPDDNGETAGGVDNSKPGVMGCALPMTLSNGKIVNGCFGSPLPNLPWRIMVQVWRADIPPTSVGRAITIPLIDVGPDLIEDRGIDLTPSAFLALGGDLKTGLLKVGYRIVEGAKYLHLTSINQGGAK